MATAASVSPDFETVNSDTGDPIEFEGFIKSVRDNDIFIRPKVPLPTGFKEGKDVWCLRPKPVENLKFGDSVTFTLLASNKDKPEVVTLIYEGNTLFEKKRKQKRTHVKPEKKTTGLPETKRIRLDDKSLFGTRPTGKIVRIKDTFGFIEPSEGFLNERVDVHFYLDKVQNGGLQLMPGDEVEFTLNLKVKNNQGPSAYQIRLVRCRNRTPQVWETYLEGLWGDLNESSGKGGIINAVSCNALWESLGRCRDLSVIAINKLLEITNTIESEYPGIQQPFKKMLKALATSPFFNPWIGCLKEFASNVAMVPEYENIKELVQKFLLCIVRHVPAKARAAIGIAKVMLPANQNDLSYFYFQFLKEMAKLSNESVEDMDWNEMPLVLSPKELHCDPLESRANLMRVKTKGAYTSVQEYMDTYFRLLRADCFDALRKGIKEELEGKLDSRDMNIYHSVKLAGIQVTNSEQGLAVALQVTPRKEVKNWETSSNLMFGNLLCISASGTFHDPIWATVIQRDPKLLREKKLILVEFCNECNMLTDAEAIMVLSYGGGKTVMAESPTYYKAYQPVLKALQNKDPEQLPFQKELVEVQPSGTSPAYINYNTTVEVSSCSNGRVETMTVDQFCNETWQFQTYLDSSQQRAVQDALKNRLAVIQGPPGTGKTFLGIKILQLIQSMNSLPKGPVLVLTYKNHALDEFLKEILKHYPKQVVRVGGRSKESVLATCNLAELKKENKKSKELYIQMKQMYDEIDLLKPKVAKALKDVLDKTVLTVETILDSINIEQIKSIMLNCDWTKDKMYIGPKKNRETVSKEYILSLLMSLEGSGESILDVVKEGNGPIRKIFEKSFQRWLPSAKIFTDVKRDISMFRTQILLEQVEQQLAQSQIDEAANDLDDERDIEDLQKERMQAASSHYKPYDSKDVITATTEKDYEHASLFCSSKDLKENIPVVELQNCPNLWLLKEQERVKLIQWVLLHRVELCRNELESLLQEYQALCLTKLEIDNQHCVNVMMNCKVVGLTITGASIHAKLIEQLKPAIVIVEEAGEVLEPQLLAVLGPWVQHMILIGDHQQLRPPVESYELTRDYHFDVSMMERLINNKMPFVTLQKQSRMRPEISLLLNDIYPDLQDNMAVVEKNRAVDCVEASVFFWDHRDPETSGRSYSNEKEAERVVRLTLFLLQQGYEPKQITILGTYQGQVRQLRRSIKEEEKRRPDLFRITAETAGNSNHGGATNESTPNDDNRIQIHTVDMYQGDENDIVIVSLVRSNNNKKVGFLKIMNRRCVSQSRSRCGLYFVGNASMLKGLKTWGNLLQTMDQGYCLSRQIPLQCPRHQDTKLYAETATDITLGSFCKVICNVNMPCGLHICQKKCQPFHGHEYCDVKVPFMFSRCGHVAIKECSKKESKMLCKHACSKKMDCQSHQCPKECTPDHEHRFCRQDVDHTHTKCGRPIVKMCHEKDEDLICHEVIEFTFKLCGHRGKRKCFEPEDKVKCKEKCPKTLKCKHPCTLKCGQRCNDDVCPECEKIKKEKAKILREKEEKERNRIRAEVDIEIEELKRKGDSFVRLDLSPHNDTAMEYYKIEDMVKKYVIPSHNWFPQVLRIEKVHNTKLKAKWLTAKRKLFDPRHAELKFHGTSKDAVNAIVEKGFIMPSNPGMFGAGIYFATDSSKSAQEIYTKQSNMLLVCNVLLGKAKVVDKYDKRFTNANLRSAEFDSVYAKRGTEQTGGVRNDEFIIYNPDQAFPEYVVHYKKVVPDTSHHNTSLESEALVKNKLMKHTLTESRTVRQGDPKDIHYRTAESQFLRLIATRHAMYGGRKLISVDYFINPNLLRKFNQKTDEMKKKYGTASEADYVLAFHGTADQNIGNIIQDNFKLSKLGAATNNRGAYGAGIYFSEFPDVSLGYGNGLLLCKVLPGRSYDCPGGMLGASLVQGYDSHRASADQKGRGHELVIFEPDQILPCYVLHTQ